MNFALLWLRDNQRSTAFRLEEHVASVLIVDDESGIRQILTRWLAPDGYEISEAENAEAALEALKAKPAEVVLCDIDMPGHGGLWLMERIRESFPHVAIILATADQTVPPSKSFRPGVIEYLVKPFRRDLVLAGVKRAVEWHRTTAGTQAQQQKPLSDWLNDLPD